MNKQDARTRFIDELDAWVANGDPAAPMPDGAAYREAVVEELASCWTDACWRDFMAEQRLQRVKCDAVDQMRSQQRDASIEAEARRALIEEVAAWLRETYPDGSGPLDAQSAVHSDHKRHYLADLLERRFGGDQEKP